MTAGVLLFLTMRVLHVALAAAWFGALAFTTFHLGPAIEQAGPAGGQLMSIMMRRGLHKYMASIGGLTVLTGVYLFWRFTGGFDPAVSSSRAGITFSIGALTGLIALILGGSMIGASGKKMQTLAPQLAGMKEGPERAALMATVEHLRQRMSTFGKIVLVLLFISIAAMALGHYI